MSDVSRFHTQLASIMQVLANAAVAEILELVNEGYAVLRLEISRHQEENAGLQRKLQLLELQAARQNEERKGRCSQSDSSEAKALGEPMSDAARERNPDADSYGTAQTPPDVVPIQEEEERKCDVTEIKSQSNRSGSKSKGTHDGMEGCFPGADKQVPPSIEKEEKNNVHLLEWKTEEMDEATSSSESERHSENQTQASALNSHPDTLNTLPMHLIDNVHRAFDGHASTHSTDKHSYAVRLTEDLQSSFPLNSELPVEHALNRARHSQQTYTLHQGGLLESEHTPHTLEMEQTSSQPVFRASDPPVSIEIGADGVKLFICPFCGKTVTRQKNLSSHLRVHTGEKPFSCMQCGKRFSDASNLKRHQTIHTGERRYICLRCGTRFTQSNSLKKHKSRCTL